jgi:hypothetical protein
MPRQRKPATRTQMKLPETIRELARIVGQGDMTNGVEQLFSQLPLFYQVKLYLSQQAETGDKTAESLLHKMEALEIDRVYQEAICEGLVVPGANGEPAAWIV